MVARDQRIDSFEILTRGRLQLENKLEINEKQLVIIHCLINQKYIEGLQPKVNIIQMQCIRIDLTICNTIQEFDQKIRS